MRILPLVLLTAIGCGSDKDNNDPQPAPIAGPEADPTESPEDVAKQQAEMPTSLAIATVAELPACDAARNQQLVYVLDAKQFQTCQAGAWVVVEITVPKPDLDVNRLHNAIMSIQIGQTLENMIPEAREYLLALGEKDIVSASVYNFVLISDATADRECNRVFHYTVRFVNNIVDSVHDACAD